MHRSTMTIIQHLQSKLQLALLLIVPAYFWYKCLKVFKSYSDDIAHKKAFFEKHNCVVMYHKEKGMIGWPAYKEALVLSMDTHSKFVEPLLYFINTAERTIDIAVMVVSHKTLIASLKKAQSRNVKIRMIVDKEKMYESELEAINNAGIEIITDVKFFDVDSIMHNKYAIKDYDKADGSGFSVCGSINWAQSGFLQNYEDLMFSTSPFVVGALHRHFEEMWDFFQKSQNPIN